jgi:hypothetical protein
LVDHVPRARWRVLGASHAGVEPRYMGVEGRRVLAEDRQLVVAGDVVLDISGPVENSESVARLWIAVAARSTQ